MWFHEAETDLLGLVAKSKKLKYFDFLMGIFFYVLKEALFFEQPVSVEL